MEQKGKKPTQVDGKLFRRTYWMSMAVFFLGMLSIVMFLLIDHINQRQGMISEINEAIMDIQICIGLSHVRLEEGISGDILSALEEASDKLDLSISLADAILNGGKSKHGLPLEPLKNLELRKRIEEMHSLLTQLKTTTLLRMQGQVSPAIEERYHARILEILDKADSLEIVLEKHKISSHARAEHLFYGLLLAWTFIVVGASIGLWSGDRKRRRAEEALEKARGHLEIKVEERTNELRNANAQLQLELNIRRKVEKELKESENHLRYLSSQLLTAQEKERKRISAELHDELGGGLSLLRIEFALIQGKLNEDQTELRERCRQNLQYIEHLTDNVSRLSRNLSPYLLEDLGLSAALRSLLSNFGKRLNIQVVSEIPEMDHQFPQDAEVTIYRIIQESLTNIGKHAQAQRVSVVVRTDDDQVCFTIEDDGKGFKVEQALSKDAGERGMGLTTMDERVRMLGGSLDLWSQEGQGSRITFQIPKKNGGWFHENPTYLTG